MKRLALLLVLACTGKSPTPPVPTYNPSTLLVENQTGYGLGFVAECCGGQRLDIPLPLGTQVCVIMRDIEGAVTLTVVGLTYGERDSILNAHSSPAWTWTLLPGDAQLRTATTPCG